jgi:16S rRNA (guanine527-N7)-methyltransferase
MDMTESHAWLRDNFGVSRETIGRFDAYAVRLVAENRSQNLISAATVSDLWNRHIVDSAQLFPLVRGRVVDIGSGAGLPGIPLALLGADVKLVEPRKRRAAFLEETVAALGLQCAVHATRVERLEARAFDTITARAYTQFDQIFASTLHLSHSGTRWVLPKGKTGLSELETVRAAWHGDFEAIASITDPQAVIIIAERIRPKAQR